MSCQQPSTLMLKRDPGPSPRPSEAHCAVVCINLLHISPASCTDALLEESALLLPSGAPLIIYGPFMRNGAHTSASNAAFDQSLRERNHQWGLRELNQVTTIAAKAGFKTENVVTMPANNLTLVFQRA